MQLSNEQLQRFHQQGFILLPNLFSADEVAILKHALDDVCDTDDPANIREKSGGVVRTAMGLHQRHPVFASLVRHPRLVEPALQILQEPVYVQQVKVNVKAAFEGEAWQWHYDFATHHHDDGVPQPLALNLHVFLDDVTEFNGPLHFIDGSHRYGPARTWHDTVSTSYPLWVVDRDVVADLVNKGGLSAATGAAGTGLIFGDCLVHSSPPNLSPFDRAIFSLILNPISNAYTGTERPPYKHHRELEPVTALADDCLLQ